MQYAIHYNKLIDKARSQSLTGYTELHHITPRSLGGTDEESNLVRLTVKQHLMAHLLLWKMGHANQLYSVAALLEDSVNPRTRRYRQIRYKRWIRREITHARSRAAREKTREQYRKIDV